MDMEVAERYAPTCALRSNRRALSKESMSSEFVASSAWSMKNRILQMASSIVRIRAVVNVAVGTSGSLMRRVFVKELVLRQPKAPLATLKAVVPLTIGKGWMTGEGRAATRSA